MGVCKIQCMIEITVNGQTREVQAETIGQLLVEMGLAGRPVAVECNRELVPARAHGDTRLQSGDALELVTLVGGG